MLSANAVSVSPQTRCVPSGGISQYLVHTTKDVPVVVFSTFQDAIRQALHVPARYDGGRSMGRTIFMNRSQATSGSTKRPSVKQLGGAGVAATTLERLRWRG
jgi:hypothetical protein